MHKDNERKIEGPARLVQDNIDETGLNYHGVKSRRDILDGLYGKKGTGWEIVHPTNESPEEKESRRLGRGLVKIVVTPDGDQHYRDKFE